MDALHSLVDLETSVGSADWSRWTKNRFQYYDYVRMPPAGTNELQFFTIPYGAADPVTTVVKTLEDTNCNESRSFGRVNFLVSEIRTHIRVDPKARQITGISNQTNAITSLYAPLMNVLASQLVHAGVLVIQLGQKEYWDINQPFIACPPGFGPDILTYGSANGTATQGLWFQQGSRPEETYRVKPEQLIEAGQTFVVKITFPHANTPTLTNLVNSVTPKVSIGVIFDGYILRPMQ
jgi:hypothetical protein